MVLEKKHKEPLFHVVKRMSMSGGTKAGIRIGSVLIGLIVGAIFGLIFSIPHLINWVGSWFKEGDEAQKFYSSYQLSLDNANKGTSQVDKLFDAIKDGKGNDFVGTDKFLLAFVQEDCHVCKDQYEGYKVLKSNWGKGEFSSLKGQDFKLITIYIDTTKKISMLTTIVLR